MKDDLMGHEVLHFRDTPWTFSLGNDALFYFNLDSKASFMSSSTISLGEDSTLVESSVTSEVSSAAQISKIMKVGKVLLYRITSEFVK